MKHLRTHMGPNIYKCDQEDCNEAFEKYNELKHHKAIHYSASDIISEEIYDEDIETMKLL